MVGEGRSSKEIVIIHHKLYTTPSDDDRRQVSAKGQPLVQLEAFPLRWPICIWDYSLSIQTGLILSTLAQRRVIGRHAIEPPKGLDGAVYISLLSSGMLHSADERDKATGRLKTLRRHAAPVTYDGPIQLGCISSSPRPSRRPTPGKRDHRRSIHMWTMYLGAD